MLEIFLTYPSPEGSKSIPVDDERMSFGRGSEATFRFEDDGLSRLNSTIYREGDRVWIVDDNSTNGTYVNGSPAAPAGTPLRDGDTIKIGHKTQFTVNIAEKSVEPAAPTAAASSSGQTVVVATSPDNAPFNWIPVAVIAGAFFIICVSVVFIGVTAFGSGGGTFIAKNNDPTSNDDPENDVKVTATKTPAGTDKPGNVTVDNSLPANLGTANTKPDIPVASGKKYLEMSDTERRQYLEIKAMRVAQVIGNNNSGAIPPAAIDKIKGFVDAYASRAKVKPKGGCSFGDNLQSTFERASKNAPFIVTAFNGKGIDPRIGLYLAMIESEHCVCLQSGTGPLGMFQFTYATAKLHFEPSDGVIKGASPGNPDIRCQPEPAARAAASYMKALTGRYGTGPASVPLAIGSYNSGEGGLSSNLQKALDSGQGLPRDFWTLIEKGDLLSKQFQSENFKYVPKFFAAAIIGENPQDFGMTLQPISTYSK
jgi:pSer/pThr/pTyr-binding forkhead associated (FHA) protein